MKHIFLVFFGFIVLNVAMGQGNSALYHKGTFGRVINLSSIDSKNKITDKLVENHVYSSAVWLTFGFSFKNGFGAELTFGYLLAQYRNSQSSFNKAADNRYVHDYLILDRWSRLPQNSRGYELKERYLFGLTYTFTKPKFLFRPKFKMGATSLLYGSGNVSLKESNTNNYLRIDFTPETDHKEKKYFILNPGVTIETSILRVFNLNLDVDYFINKGKIPYYVKEYNLNDDVTTVLEEVTYKKFSHSLSISLGLSFYFIK